MDSNDLVQQITAKVIERLGQTLTPGTSPGYTNVTSNDKALILLTGSEHGLQNVLALIEQLAEQYSKVVIAISPSAEKIIGLPALRRTVPAAEVLMSGEVAAILEGVDAIYLPNMSLNAAAKIGRLTPDSFVCILAIEGLLRAIPMIASKDSIFPAGIDQTKVPTKIRQRIERMLTNLSDMGAKVCSLTDLLKQPAMPLSSQPGQTALICQCSQSHNGDCSACGKCVSINPQAVESLLSSGANRVAAAIGTAPSSQDVAAMIDHTLLKPDATEAQIKKLCQEALQHGFASVCVNPSWVSLAAQLVAGSRVKVCTVIGFPLGATTPTAKSIETRDAIANGAEEIDMVLNVGALKSGDDQRVKKDIEAVVQAVGGKAIVKVILETALLTREEKIKACLLAKMAGADFVKTSTGFSSGGATVEDIALMRETVGPEMGVKASGGVGDIQTAKAMLAAGATRIGASASVAIATGQKTSHKGY
jgi:deoxyribose-phosphate aldolase